ncbi:MAG: restriction endonuclease [Clostridiales bacterium]|nr:restriction endonuclease [Clostridiales bacterium]
MDFKDNIKQIADRVDKMKDNIKTEEATKNAFIMPFITALGYDVFNPVEVVPEMICDIGAKKGEKIDYAIHKDGEPIILIECKHWQQDLSLHDNQLLRYFGVSKAKFGILTNGIIYRFYTDLAKENVMDDKPFLEVNLLDLKDNQIEELKKFHKSYFDTSVILSSATELKYANELKGIIAQEFQTPSEDFTKFLGKQVYDGLFTPKVCAQFQPIVKKSISSYINDIISDRLKAAIKEGEDEQQTQQREEAAADEKPESKIFTSEEELQAFYIIRSILATVCPVEEIVYRDSQTRFTIFHASNMAKSICRFESTTNEVKRMVITFQGMDNMVCKLESPNDLYTFADDLRKSLSLIIDGKQTKAKETAPEEDAH